MAQSETYKQNTKTKWTNLAKFRFQDLKIWQLAIQIAHELFDIADLLESRKLYRFAEQLRGSGMSMSNNIAEGSERLSKAEFRQFLGYAKGSAGETRSQAYTAEALGYLTKEEACSLRNELKEISRMIRGLINSLDRPSEE